MTYDKAGRRKTMTRPNNLVTTTVYDVAGRLTSSAHKQGATTFAQFDYTVNGRGDRLTAVNQVRRPDGGVDHWRYVYTYDALARLQEANYSLVGVIEGSLIANFRYDYDVTGNRLKAETFDESPSAGTLEYEYNAGNQIARRRSNGGAWVNFTYDNNGNLTNDGTNAYTWDRVNRLLNVGAAGANVSKYDGLGNRVSRTNSGFTTNLLNDLQPSLAQTVAISFPSLGTTSRQVQTPMGVLAQEDPSGAWEWMLADGLGSVRSVTNNSGAVLEHRHYEPYGSLFAGAMAETPFGFTGEWRDGGTGMYYLRARYYNPAIGTFVSRDPYEGTAARAMSLNGYSWVEGRVADGRDPSGMLTFLTQNDPLAISQMFNQGALCFPSEVLQNSADKCKCCSTPLQSLICNLSLSLSCTCPSLAYDFDSSEYPLVKLHN